MKIFLLSNDFLGFQPHLHVDGKSRFQSAFTTILSILVTLVTLICFGYLSCDLVFRTKPMVYYTGTFLSSFEKLELSNQGLNTLFYIFDGDGSLFVDPSVYTVEGNLIRYSNIYNIMTNKNELVQKLANIQIDVCSKWFKYSDFSKTNLNRDLDLDLDLVYCPDPSKAFIEGFRGLDEYSSFKLQFLKCQNTTKNNNMCKPSEEIERIIQNKHIGYQLTSYIVDESNFTNPLVIFLSQDFNIINVNSSLEYNIQLQMIEFNSDSGFILRTNSIYQGFKSTKNILFRNTRSDELVTFSIEGSSQANVYKRSYVKLLSILSQTGGFVKLVVMIAYFLSDIYSKHYFFIHYLNRIFSEKEFKENLSNSAANIVNPQNPEILNKDSSMYKNRPDLGLNTLNNGNIPVHLDHNFIEDNKDIKQPEIPNGDSSVNPTIKRKFSRKVTFKEYKTLRCKNTYHYKLFEHIWSSLTCKKKLSHNCRLLKGVQKIYATTVSLDILMQNNFDLEFLKSTYKEKYNFNALFSDAVNDRIKEYGNFENI